MKGPQRRKASVEVSKLIFVFSHNSHRVLEWSIVNSKTNFVAWKSYVLIVFRKEYYLAIFFHFELQKGYLNRDRSEKLSQNFWNLPVKREGNFRPKWNCICYDGWIAMQYLRIFTMVAS